MVSKRILITLAVLLSVSLSGCHCWCPPKEWFSFIDRNCYVADVTNSYSCTSCRYCANSGSQPNAELPGRTIEFTAPAATGAAAP